MRVFENHRVLAKTFWSTMVVKRYREKYSARQALTRFAFCKTRKRLRSLVHGKRKRGSKISLQRTRDVHRQSYEHWNYFKGNIGKTADRRGGGRGGAHMGFSEGLDTILN